MLNINLERAGSTAMVHGAGRIVVGEDLSALRDAVLCELCKRNIVLDLSRVGRIDAGGLGMLVFLHNCAHGLSTEFKLLSPSPQVVQMLESHQAQFGVHSLWARKYCRGARAFSRILAVRSVRLTVGTWAQKGIQVLSVSEHPSPEADSSTATPEGCSPLSVGNSATCNDSVSGTSSA